MVVATRSTSATQVLEHILTNILRQPEGNDPVRLCLQQNGINELPDLMMLSEDDIRALRYQLPAPTEENAEANPAAANPAPRQSLTVPQQRKLSIFVMFAQAEYVKNSGPLGADMWMLMDFHPYDAYRVSPNLGVAPPNGSPPPRTQRVSDPVADFKKSIKRDKTHYKEFKDEKYWDNWNRSFTVTARSHGLDHIIDHTFVPSTTSEKDLFDEEQKFAFSVLESCLHTDMGKTLVRQHVNDSDAQKVYAALCDHQTKSAKAKITSASLLAYITSARYSSQWRGTSTSFILHWQNQLRQLDDMTAVEDQFSKAVRLMLLENAVNAVEDLRQVKVTAQLDETKGGSKLTYENYVSLLLAAATQYDSSISAQKAGRANRQVAFHDFLIEPEPDPDEGIDIDLPPDSFLEANVHQRAPEPRKQDNPHQRTFIPYEQWSRLSEESKRVLSEKYKEKKAKSLQGRQSLATNVHEVVEGEDAPSEHEIDHELHGTDDGENHDREDEVSEPFLAHMTNQRRLPPGDIKRMLSQSTAHPTNKSVQKQSKGQTVKKSVTVDGTRYYTANQAVLYSVSKLDTTAVAALMDGGANGGLAGEDTKVLNRTGRKVDISGIDDHQVTGLDIVTAAGLVETQNGKCVLIMHQYAYLGKGKTIHSKGQVEWYKNSVDDKSRALGGKQRVVTLDGYIIPLHIRNGLPYMDMMVPTQQELDSLPHIILTADTEWNPKVLDNEVDLDAEWSNEVVQLPEDYDYGPHAFDSTGNYLKRYIHKEHQIHHREPDYAALRPYFGWSPSDIIKRTFAVTTQFARQIMRDRNLREHYRTRFPACNVSRRNEAVACDMVYADTPAVDDGSTAAAFFAGRSSLACSAHGTKTDKQFINALEDEIRTRGAMDKLISDRGTVEISNKVLDLLRAFVIEDYQSEPYHQNQNFAERRYHDVKAYTNTIMNRTGSPANTWLLCLKYVCFLLNRLATASLGWKTPLQILTGQTADISALLQYHFWEPIYYRMQDARFPSTSDELRGHWVGVAETVGDALTYLILTEDTQTVIYRSAIRSAADTASANLRALASGDGEPPQIFVKSKSDSSGSPRLKSMQGFAPDDLIGRTFLTTPNDQGERHRATIHQKILHEDDDERIEFLIKKGNGMADEIVAYNDILAHLEREYDESKDGERQWRFRDITAHEGPLSPGDKSYKGSTYNVLVEWETGETTFEPLSVIIKDDPVTCAMYAKRNGLLDTPGWKRLKRLARREKVITRLANQAKLHQLRRAPKYKFGVEVPRDHKHAMELDAKAGNHKWKEAEELEKSQLFDYSTFVDCGKAKYKGKDVSNVPKGYKRIRCHMIYDVKHDGRYKARFVAGGHLTAVPSESVYSGVVSLRSLRLVTFLAELNKLELWGADIGNAYLEAKTKEQVYFVAGDEFGDLAGHVFLIDKALYGLRTSGARWHERFADTLRDMGFTPSKADPDVWMRAAGDCYEYIAVYVDDLAIAAKDPAEIVRQLREEYNFKLKGDGPLDYHLGCNFFRDPDGVLCYGPKKYISKIMINYERLFGEKPKEYSSPLEKGDHPELDTSDELDHDGITKYQSLIGALQWLITLGRFDIATAVMTMSRFRAAPRQGHMERLKHIFGYVKKMKEGYIRVRTGHPDYSDLSDQEYDWAYSVYGKVTENIPQDAPEALGFAIILTTYLDANLYHDYVTGRSVSGILHFINQTLFDWYSKKQATVETATFGSEFVAARIATDQIIDIRLTLRYLGVPIIGKSYMFGDNESMVKNSSMPHSTLQKRHLALSYHKVREAIASKVVGFYWIDGNNNPADVVTKHWGMNQAWPHIRPILFCRGDTYKSQASDILARTNGECYNPSVTDESRAGGIECVDPVGLDKPGTKDRPKAKQD